MKQSDRKKFLEIVIGFAELKGKTLSAAALELYWQAMQQWAIEDFQVAAEQLLRTCEWMPTPKHFEDLRKAGRPTCGEAWIRACQNAPSAIVCGQVTSGASCGDLFIDRAVAAIGGYGVIAMCESDKLCFLERRFAEHYEAMQDAQETREAVPQIAGGTFRGRLQGPQSAKDILARLPKPN